MAFLILRNNNINIMYSIGLMCLLSTTFVTPRYDWEEGIRPYKMGNFALPATQWPSPAFSFGQNIIPQGVMFAEVYLIDEHGDCTNFFTAIPDVLYGIRDDLSVILAAPVVVNRADENRSKGIGDVLLQFEYAYHLKTSKTDLNLASIVFTVGLPTGSAHKIPTTGYSASSFFIGLTAAHLGIDWYVFTSHGVTVPRQRYGTKFGNEFLYQFGLGHNLCHLQNSILLGLLELNGRYRVRDRIQGTIDHDSGGNVVYFGPSVFFSRTRVALQGGFQMVATQHLFGTQPEFNARSIIQCSYTF